MRLQQVYCRRVWQLLLWCPQARTQAAVAVALSGDVQQALEWEAHQQLLPPPPLTPALVQQWRYAHGRTPHTYWLAS